MELMFVVKLLHVGGVTVPGVDVLVGAVVVGAVVVVVIVGVVVCTTPQALYGVLPAHADISVVH